MERFAAILRAAGIAASVRISKGQDIRAGCGQLKVAERSEAHERDGVAPVGRASGRASGRAKVTAGSGGRGARGGGCRSR